MPHSTQDFVVDTTQATGDWRDQLLTDGYVVLKGILDEEKAKSYVDRMLQWLTTFPYGFDRSDSNTWDAQHLPAHMKGGMYHEYSVQHERFMWDARCEPRIIEAFAKLWNTKKLLVSFDGMNLTLPTQPRATSDPWPHVDQSPQRKGMQCVQGILNLMPNGEDDGGLVVMKGSNKFNEEFFKTHEHSQQTSWGPNDWFGFTAEQADWFRKKGCEQVKVCAGPGDLILWDSRTVHYNVLPATDNIRAVMYLCYTPASLATEADLASKAELFRNRVGTTHWPHSNIFPTGQDRMRLGKPDTCTRSQPHEHPEESERLLQLAGVVSYD